MDIIIAVLVLTTSVAMIGAALGLAGEKMRANEDQLVDDINQLLPQTQCAQCGYPGCRPYAQAIADGDDINKCPPGGEQTVEALADMLGKEIIPLAKDSTAEQPTVAFIREAECIGCTKCIDACPVDAILGAAKLMHTVIEQECTGCDLCVEPCPVDCIDILPSNSKLLNQRFSKPLDLTHIPVKQI